MFHEGDIQSGIALALKESRYVICLVRDDAEASSTWEHQYLADEEVSKLLKEKAVVLRLNAGSQEAGFLSSFCPVGDIPTLVVVKDGKLLEYITGSVAAEEFKSRLKASLETTPQAAQTTQARSHPIGVRPQSTPARGVTGDATSTAPQAAQAAQDAQAAQARQQTVSSAAPSQSTPAQVAPAAPNLQPNPSEQDSEAQRRETIRAGKRPEEKEPENVPKPEKDEWRKQQRKLEQQQKEERQRVLDQIKQDNIERQRRDEHRKATAMMRPASLQPLTPTKLEQIRLQVRLFDGTSIRTTFLPSHTIRHNVRPWIDEQRSDGAAPYTLKQILAPHPNRKITTAEENDTLEALNLGPTANLIIVPVRAYTEAYPNESTSSLAHGIHAGYEFLFNLVAAIAEIFATLLGIRHAPSTTSGPPQSTGQSAREKDQTHASVSGSVRDRGAQQTETSASGSVRGTSSGLNFRTLRDQRDEQKDEEFYNGNQLNFQPRPDLDDSEGTT